ncbi:MAG: hypothetical protein ACR2MX_16745 [Cyclobacteriaceae bacterium]
MRLLFYFLGMLCCIGCEPDQSKQAEATAQGLKPNFILDTTFIAASPQRNGDPVKGKQYLLSGKYMNSGLPTELFRNPITGSAMDSESEPTAGYSIIKASSNVEVVTANCLQCHAQKLNGVSVIGLGNSLADFTLDPSAAIPQSDLFIKSKFGEQSPEYQAYNPFAKAIYAMGPQLITEVRGANPADKMAAILAAHRDQETLEWRDEPKLPIPKEVIPTDVPAWWLLKKKNAMFYTTVGRGDFARLMMASSLLTMKDSTEAAEIDRHFADVQAYIYSLEPPQYPDPLDEALIAEGAEVFEKRCSTCHGSYGDIPTYPNLLVGLKTIKTDSMLTLANFSNNRFVEWYNTSWFSKGRYGAQLVPEKGYLAPPLDGIWATAPYLHNGSVPTLADLLDSKQRPKIWRRSFDDSDYDYEKVGWNYRALKEKADKLTYDTSYPGYGNQGHNFGDRLTDNQRSSLIEYLKTL